jgi:hypothetical protein
LVDFHSRIQRQRLETAAAFGRFRMGSLARPSIIGTIFSPILGRTSKQLDKKPNLAPATVLDRGARKNPLLAPAIFSKAILAG